MQDVAIPLFNFYGMLVRFFILSSKRFRCICWWWRCRCLKDGHHTPKMKNRWTDDRKRYTRQHNHNDQQQWKSKWSQTTWIDLLTSNRHLSPKSIEWHVWNEATWNLFWQHRIVGICRGWASAKYLPLTNLICQLEMNFIEIDFD